LFDFSTLNFYLEFVPWVVLAITGLTGISYITLRLIARGIGKDTTAMVRTGKIITISSIAFLLWDFFVLCYCFCTFNLYFISLKVVMLLTIIIYSILLSLYLSMGNRKILLSVLFVFHGLIAVFIGIIWAFWR
jgi:hypothetical protein